MQSTYPNVGWCHLGFDVICHKTQHNTQCYIAFQAYDCCPFMLLVC